MWGKRCFFHLEVFVWQGMGSRGRAGCGREVSVRFCWWGGGRFGSCSQRIFSYPDLTQGLKIIFTLYLYHACIHPLCIYQRVHWSTWTCAHMSKRQPFSSDHTNEILAEVKTYRCISEEWVTIKGLVAFYKHENVLWCKVPSWAEPARSRLTAQLCQC